MDEAKLYFKLLKQRVLDAIENDVEATEYEVLNPRNVSAAFYELEMLE